MISQTYKNPKFKVNQPTGFQSYSNNNNNSILSLPATVTPYVSRDMEKIRDRAKRVGISMSDWLKRDNIVMQMARDCHFKVGEIFYPANEDWFAQHGRCVVEGIVTTYTEIDTVDTWPTDDVPYIISARSLAKGSKFICVPSFMSRVGGTQV